MRGCLAQKSFELVQRIGYVLVDNCVYVSSPVFRLSTNNNLAETSHGGGSDVLSEQVERVRAWRGEVETAQVDCGVCLEKNTACLGVELVAYKGESVWWLFVFVCVLGLGMDDI